MSPHHFGRSRREADRAERRALLAGLLALPLASLCFAAPFPEVDSTQDPPAGQDPKAPAVAAKTEDPPVRDEDKAARAVIARIASYVGTPEAFRAIASLRFRVVIEAGGKLVSERRVNWDKRNDRVRVDLTTKNGAVACAFTRSVRAASGAAEESKSPRFVVRVSDQPVEGKEAEQIHAYVSKVFRGDWNQFTLAHRLEDAGVRSTLEPSAEKDEAGPDRLAITFDATIPGFDGDRFWLVADHATGVPKAFLFHAKAMPPTQAPLRFDYTEWHEIAGVKLPRVLTGVGTPQVVKFDGIESPAEFEAGTFLGVE